MLAASKHRCHVTAGAPGQLFIRAVSRSCSKKFKEEMGGKAAFRATKQNAFPIPGAIGFLNVIPLAAMSTWTCTMQEGAQTKGPDKYRLSTPFLRVSFYECFCGCRVQQVSGAPAALYLAGASLGLQVSIPTLS
ncbi:hypothetical protein E2C01_045339 [Portunus trituberculatus]|uniref:Uncharacterized protein n=1 Tax=Portunus trituberculatus TaxID=210409 RepID=A0A5B7G2L5_PORTR|nr:hypothetical protein [Portunus trituberculatus]